MLFPMMRILSFSIAAFVPLPMIALEGRLVPAGPMLLLEIVMLSFPVVAPAPTIMVPATVANVEAEDPRIVQLVTVLLVASAMKRIVPLPAVVPAVVFEIVSELPVVLSPLIVTLSAPLRSISGLPAVVAPVTVRAPAGVIVSAAQEP